MAQVMQMVRSDDLDVDDPNHSHWRSGDGEGAGVAQARAPQQSGNLFVALGGPLPKRRDEYVLAVCSGMTDLASSLFNIPGKELRAPGRCNAAVARTRQLAMYVTHVALQLSMAEVGKGFGRDRTTVIHACHLIEDLRDDQEFDALTTQMERIAIQAFGAAGQYGDD